MTTVNGANYAGVSNYASQITYRAFGAVKGMNYSNGRVMSAAYNERMQMTSWDVAGILGYNYFYHPFDERTGRVTFAQSHYDFSLNRSYEYDQVGRLILSHSGNEADAHAGAPGGAWGTPNGPYSQGYDYDVWGNLTHKYGWGGEVHNTSPDIYYSYTNNRRNGFTYDASGNLTNDLGQTFTYDATGQQATSDYTNLHNYYDGDGLRVKKTDSSTYGGATYYLRSSVLGGQVVAEIRLDGENGTASWSRGYVYAGTSLLAVQQNGVFFVHEDAVTKSKRVTDINGNIVSSVETDPWGADTARSSNGAFQPKKFTSYERDANGSDEAMARRYNRWHSRFDQPDPYEGSYDLGNPQSLNRYAYVGNDPVNFVDPTGLDRCVDVDTGVVFECPSDAEIGETVRINIWTLGDWNFTSGGRSGLVWRPRQYVVEDRFSERGRSDPQNPAQRRQGVEQCSRPADLTSLGINWNVFGLSHRWLRTSQVEAGAGPAGGGVPGRGASDSPYVTQMTMNNHAGQGNQPGSTCTPLPNVDVGKVNAQLEIGKPLGRFNLLNNCWTTTNQVIRNASPPESRPANPRTGLPVGTQPMLACPYSRH
jgi:RHS repeat-associated protein